jgi:hypothetical protein
VVEHLLCKHEAQIPVLSKKPPSQKTNDRNVKEILFGLGVGGRGEGERRDGGM